MQLLSEIMLYMLVGGLGGHFKEIGKDIGRT